MFCLDYDEWDKEHIIWNIDHLNDMESLKNNTVILDGQGSMKLEKQVANLISKGRHFNIQLIFLAHITTDVNPKGRHNIKEIYITTGNSKKKIIDIKDRFMIEDLSRFSNIDYGIIKYNLCKNTFIVYDKNQHIIYDSNENKAFLRSDFDIKKYLNKEDFSDLEKSEIVKFLESKADINVTPHLLKFYLNYYLIQMGEKPNISKLKNLISDYYDENKQFKQEKIIPYIKLFKDTFYAGK